MAAAAGTFGPRTLVQLDGNLGAFTVRLSKEQMEKLDQIFPGRGGESPEVYAW